MRGTIVVLADKRTLIEDEHYCPWADYEMREWIPGCDGVIQDDLAGFQESLQCLNEAYGLDIQRTTVNIDSAKLEVGILDGECLRSLMEALQKDKKKRLEKVREELDKSDPHMWRIADDAYMNSNVYFAVVDMDHGASLENEMDFCCSMQNEAGPLYVVATYRFHV